MAHHTTKNSTDTDLDREIDIGSRDNRAGPIRYDELPDRHIPDDLPEPPPDHDEADNLPELSHRDLLLIYEDFINPRFCVETAARRAQLPLPQFERALTTGSNARRLESLLRLTHLRTKVLCAQRVDRALRVLDRILSDPNARPETARLAASAILRAALSKPDQASSKGANTGDIPAKEARATLPSLTSGERCPPQADSEGATQPPHEQTITTSAPPQPFLTSLITVDCSLSPHSVPPCLRASVPVPAPPTPRPAIKGLQGDTSPCTSAPARNPRQPTTPKTKNARDEHIGRRRRGVVSAQPQQRPADQPGLRRDRDTGQHADLDLRPDPNVSGHPP